MDENWLFWAKFQEKQLQSALIPIFNTKPKLTLCINYEKTIYVNDIYNQIIFVKTVNFLQNYFHLEVIYDIKSSSLYT
jgi:hypothetical protein